ncbi:hypothetical protein B0H17DRAFT_1026648 [Mycena rosella]|uniref:DUF6532 domain-containing protein n=1 Tax=Mycena rosella TaxID=1033263 RepID=A0AAD7AX04_MYCRO|nr:hypothetical protein B0H17DRAFT_1026648 [Mycena rosella]
MESNSEDSMPDAPKIRRRKVDSDIDMPSGHPHRASTRPESSWDVSARLVLPAVNKDIGLTAQHPEFQAVLRDTMSIIKIYMWFDDAYPLMASRPGFCRPHLITAAQARGAVHILERLLKDPAFGAILAPILCDRMNLHRANVKRCAVSCVLAFYKLADLAPDQVKTHIEELLKDHRYIFSVDSEPFNHGSIRFVLKEEILSSASFVTQNIDRFPAKAATAHKPILHEVADPMVAIAATAVYAALVEYRMTGQRQNIPFTEDAYEDTYRNHMSSLRDLRTRYANALHQRFHELFKDTTYVFVSSVNVLLLTFH